MIHAGIVVGVVVVLCIALLLALAVIGVRRYGLATLSNLVLNKGACGTSDEKQEMEWDHSELNITVNPLEAECTYEEDGCAMYEDELAHTGVCIDKNMEQAEASEQEQEEEEEVERDATKSAIVKELEWDDSILSL